MKSIRSPSISDCLPRSFPNCCLSVLWETFLFIPRYFPSFFPVLFFVSLSDRPPSVLLLRLLLTDSLLLICLHHLPLSTRHHPLSGPAASSFSSISMVGPCARAVSSASDGRVLLRYCIVC